MSTINNAIHMHTTLKLFDRAYSSGWWSKVRGILGKPAPRLLELEALAGAGQIRSRHFEGRQYVPLAQILGSENRVDDFDARFHPRTRHLEERWRGIASAWLRGLDLPPVELIRVGEVYFVRDGHHRISVAAALGQWEIDALVTEWEIDAVLPVKQYETLTWEPSHEDVAPALAPAV